MQTELVGEHPFGNDVPQDLRVRQRRPACVDRDIAERIEAEFEGLCHRLTS